MLEEEERLATMREQALERLFTGVSVERRQQVEGNPFYQRAVKNHDLVKAEEIASEMLFGNATSQREARAARKNRQEFNQLQDAISKIIAEAESSNVKN